MSDRGMKKWMPFSSLVEQHSYLNKMKSTKSNVEKPMLSEDQQSEINNLLVNYNNELIEISYYKGGKILNINGFIKKIDYIDKCIQINHMQIKLENIIFIKKL